MQFHPLTTPYTSRPPLSPLCLSLFLPISLSLSLSLPLSLSLALMISPPPPCPLSCGGHYLGEIGSRDSFSCTAPRSPRACLLKSTELVLAYLCSLLA